MKTILNLITAIGLVFTAQTYAQVFNGATATPFGKVSRDSLNQQFRIQFPVSMKKADAFSVTCAPAALGTASWADNNSIWTYNLQGDYPGLPGGAKCVITQTQELVGTNGQVWTAGTINYSIEVGGPNITSVEPLGFGGKVREKQPVFLLRFDGEIVLASFFASQNAYLSYSSGNAPAEKIQLIPIAADKAQEITTYYNERAGAEGYWQLDLTKTNWVLATVGQDLIPGSLLTLNVSNIQSKYNSAQVSDEKYSQEVTVRDNFNAKVECARPSENSPLCLPQGTFSIELSAKAKWADLQQAYIEYVPFNSTDGKTVRSFPEVPEVDENSSFVDRVLNWVGHYMPMATRLSDTLVEKVTFKLKIEPQTSALVVIPDGLTDVDGRVLVNTNKSTQLLIGSPKEMIRVPQDISFFEKNVPQVSLPIGVVNLNQDIKIRKTGTNNLNWTPIRDYANIIKLIRAYAERGDFRDVANYVSPMDTLGVVNQTATSKLTGPVNRSTFLQLNFGQDAQGTGGLYAMEISSPTYESEMSDPANDNYFNPQYVLSQVTNLAVHMKLGEEKSLVWVTQLDTGSPVAGADIEIRNCLGDVVLNLKSDATGIASFDNRPTWAADCQKSERSRDYSYGSPSQFFVFAKTPSDFTFSHTSWIANNSYALGAPGVDYFYTPIKVGRAFFHAIIGVNLVKPGQKVPVQIIAKLPTSTGYAEVPVQSLPKRARVTYANDPEVYFDFPVTWNNGTAQFTWNVPGDSSTKLGGYEITLVDSNDHVDYVNDANIEVAEFKVPLMSGVVAFPVPPLVRPASIPVNTTVRYANGVGAKDLAISLSYYFQSSPLYFNDFANFRFATGILEKVPSVEQQNQDLPSEDRPALIENLKTDAAGSLRVDIAQETLPDGRLIADVLKSVAQSQKLVVRARYQDQMGEFQTLSTSKEIYTAQKFVGTNLVPGDRAGAKLQIAVVGADGKTALNAADLDISMFRIDTKVIGEELFGGLIRNTYERDITPARWTRACSLDNGALSCAIGTLKEGTYALEATTKSDKQSAHLLFKVDTQGRVYSSDSYYDFGDDEKSKQLPLALNKPSYKAGDRAIVSFSAPFKQCSALVTLERDSIVSSFVSLDACTKGFVELPIDTALAPNVFVSIYAITGRADSAALNLGDLDLGRPTYRIGFANVKIDVAAYKLAVAVNTDKQTYKPGEMVNVQVQVNPEMGSLSQGKMTFVAIEEKLLELKDNQTYDVLQAFMQLRGNEVSTSTALDRIETVTATNPNGESEDAKETRKGGDEGGDGGQGELKRKLFDALVTFQTDIPVVGGVATASFKANDSLTKFKIFAIVTDAGQKFGTGTANYLAMQDTQSYANIPPVAYTGDNYPVRVNVQNNGAKDQTYTVEVDVVSKDASGKVVSTNKLKNSARVGSSSATVVDVGNMEVADGVETVEYAIRIYDENGKLVDALEPEAQRIYATVPLAIHDAYILQTSNGRLSQSFSKEPTALVGKGDVTTTLASSLVNGVRAQIRSRIAASTVDSVFIEDRINAAVLTGSAAHPDDLQAVLGLLVNYTDAKGLVKYFPDSSRGSVWLTASLLQTLSTESWTTGVVPVALKAKLALAVKNVLNKSLSDDYIGVDPATWLLAQMEFAQVAHLYGDADDLATAQSVADAVTALPVATVRKMSNIELTQALALLAQFKPATALNSSVYTELTATNRVRFVGNQAQLIGAPNFSFFGYGDETIDSAMLVRSISKLNGSANLARALAVGIVNASKAGWYISRSMVWVSAGMKEFSQRYESMTVNGSTRIDLAVANVSQNLNWSTSPNGIKMVTPWLPQQDETLSITHKGQGQPWVSVQTRTAVPLTAPVTQGLSITKSIKNVTRVGDLQPGDIAEVTLTIHSAASIYHVGLQDPIPAGSNVVGEAFGSFSFGEKSYRGYQLYFEYLSQGETVVKYSYQINNIGTFNLPPTRIEGLYIPSIFGETPNAAITVK